MALSWYAGGGDGGGCVVVAVWWLSCCGWCMMVCILLPVCVDTRTSISSLFTTVLTHTPPPTTGLCSVMYCRTCPLCHHP